MTNERNTNLDLIKSVACISVVGLHAVSMNNYTLYYLCDCGVPLFFMVNGYLLLSRERISFRYVFYKLAHILKIVLSWNFLIAIPVLIFRQKIINPFRLAFDSLLQKGYLWHFWFFGALMIIYLFLPILHRLIYEKKHFHRAVCLILMAVCLCMSTLSMVKGLSVCGPGCSTFYPAAFLPLKNKEYKSCPSLSTEYSCLFLLWPAMPLKRKWGFTSYTAGWRNIFMTIFPPLSGTACCLPSFSGFR